MLCSPYRRSRSWVRLPHWTRLKVRHQLCQHAAAWCALQGKYGMQKLQLVGWLRRLRQEGQAMRFDCCCCCCGLAAA